MAAVEDTPRLRPGTSVAETPAVTNKTTVITRKRGDEPTRTTTTQVQGARPGRPSETTTTTTSGERTTLERVLGDGGVVMLQIAAVALAAFLAAAVVQRVLLGKYGGLKIGTLELGEIAEASTAGIDELKHVKKAQEESRREDASLRRVAKRS